MYNKIGFFTGKKMKIIPYINRTILPTVISSTQSAFVPTRLYIKLEIRGKRMANIYFFLITIRVPMIIFFIRHK